MDCGETNPCHICLLSLKRVTGGLPHFHRRHGTLQLRFDMYAFATAHHWHVNPIRYGAYVRICIYLLRVDFVAWHAAPDCIAWELTPSHGVARPCGRTRWLSEKSHLGP